MNRFRTVREAKEYLISQILAQADRDGVPLSDVEQNMLYFSETGWTLPNIMSVNQEFDQRYDQDEYEQKIRQIVRRAHNQHDSTRDDGWDQAVERLRDEDHYLLVLIDDASGRSEKSPRDDKVRLVLAGLVIVAVFLPIVFFVFSHVDNQEVSKLIVGSTLLALVILVSFLANRGRRGSA